MRFDDNGDEDDDDDDGDDEIGKCGLFASLEIFYTNEKQIIYTVSYLRFIFPFFVSGKDGGYAPLEKSTVYQIHTLLECLMDTFEENKQEAFKLLVACTSQHPHLLVCMLHCIVILVLRQRKDNGSLGFLCMKIIFFFLSDLFLFTIKHNIL
jgi:hypothetical protein